jgi:hypothetical protein
MDHRALLTFMIVALSIGVLPACIRSEPTRTLVVGDTVPSEWTDGKGTQALLWTFRTRDCLSCDELDREIRRIQMEHRPTLPLLALHVGVPADSTIPRAFFRSRRVQVKSLRHIGERSFHRRYPEAILPTLYLVRQGRVVWMSTSQGTYDAATPSLDSILSDPAATADDHGSIDQPEPAAVDNATR